MDRCPRGFEPRSCLVVLKIYFNATKQKLTWSDIIWNDFPHLRFQIMSVNDVLPSLVKLYRWGKIETPIFTLCPWRPSLQHVLSGCPKALSDGRYRWGHDKVLSKLTEIFNTAIRSSKFNPKKETIQSVRAGEKKKPACKRPTRGVLSSASDWQLMVDLGCRLRLPEHIVISSLRPDMVVFSNSTKQVILRELTIPWEENMEVAQ